MPVFLIPQIGRRYYLEPCYYLFIGKRGPKPKGKVEIKWSANFAYALGLLATDGYVSVDGRHVTLTSKDEEQLDNFCRCLNIQVKLSTKSNGNGDLCGHVQFSDTLFHNFLCSIGISGAKSKTIGAVKIPNRYFFDFLRGSFDGDGSFYSYMDSRWEASFMFYTVFASASKKHISWLRTEIKRRLGINGHITQNANRTVFQLKYAKHESLELLPSIYYGNSAICLSRKRMKVDRVLRMAGLNNSCPGGEIG